MTVDGIGRDPDKKASADGAFSIYTKARLGNRKHSMHLVT